MPASSNTTQRLGTERAFSLIEVIVAMIILSVVMAGASFAVVAGESSEMRSKGVADQHGIAERAFERLQADLTQRETCETTGGSWRAAAASHVQGGSTSPAQFAACTVSYTDLRDDDGRRYTVTLSVKPLDDDGDGTGANDVDKNLRDDYSVEARVELAADSRAGLESLTPVEVPGSVDWGETTTDMATVRIHACGVNRPDRSLMAGACAVADTERTPLAGVTFTLEPRGEPGNTATSVTMTTNGSGTATATATVKPGEYVIKAPATASGHRFFRLDPQAIRVEGGSRHEVLATYVKAAVTVNVCTQIENLRDPNDGYEVTATNLHYRRAGVPGHRSMRIFVDPNDHSRFWCQQQLVDPLEYSTTTQLYRGMYDIEVEQVRRSVPQQIWGLRLTGASLNCNTQAPHTAAMGGTLLASRGFKAEDDREQSAGATAPSFYGRFSLGDGGTQTLCLRFYSKQFDREVCNPTYPHTKTITYSYTDYSGATQSGSYEVTDYDRPEYAPGCFYAGNQCIQYCPSGQQVCVSSCAAGGSGSAGWLSYEMVAEAAKPFGGPGDPTVGCRPQAKGGYQWFGWTPSVILEGQVGQQATQAEFSAYQWVGGGEYYYNNFSGHYASGPVYYCEDISFAASWKYLCKQGSSQPAAPNTPGFVECRYHYGDCIQAELTQYPGVYVRGIMRDISVNYTKPIIPSIGALRELSIRNSLNRTETENGWSPGTWWDNLDIKIAKVNGEPTCPDGPVMEWREPVYQETWQRVVNDPYINAVPAPATTEIGVDRVAV